MNKPERGKILKRSLGALLRQGLNIENYNIRHLGISGAQARYMDVIRENPGISQDTLARMFKVDKGAVARAAKKLEDSGYIVRRRKAGDSRVWQLFVTDEGMCVNEKLQAEAMEFEKKMLAGFSEEETETLCSMLDRVADNIDKMNEETHKCQERGESRN